MGLAGRGRLDDLDLEADARSRGASSSATCASLPGGLLVLSRTSSCSSETTSLCCAVLGASRHTTTAIPAVTPRIRRTVMLQAAW